MKYVYDQMNLWDGDKPTLTVIHEQIDEDIGAMVGANLNFDFQYGFYVIRDRLRQMLVENEKTKS
jgi:hypothetical protein